MISTLRSPEELACGRRTTMAPGDAPGDAELDAEVVGAGARTMRPTVVLASALVRLAMLLRR